MGRSNLRIRGVAMNQHHFLSDYWQTQIEPDLLQTDDFSEIVEASLNADKIWKMTTCDNCGKFEYAYDMLWTSDDHCFCSEACETHR